MTRGHRRPSRASQATLLGFSAVAIASAALLSVGIGWIATDSARDSGMAAAATVRQGDIEGDIWSVIDVADIDAPLSAAAVAELNDLLPSAFRPR